MAIRRTREDKLQAKMQREDGAYSWEPVEEKKPKTPEVQAKKTRSWNEKYFWKDLQRTLVSVFVVVALLIVGWYFLGR